VVGKTLFGMPIIAISGKVQPVKQQKKFLVAREVAEPKSSQNNICIPVA